MLLVFDVHQLHRRPANFDEAPHDFLQEELFTSLKTEPHDLWKFGYPGEIWWEDCETMVPCWFLCKSLFRSGQFKVQFNDGKTAFIDSSKLKKRATPLLIPPRLEPRVLTTVITDCACSHVPPGYDITNDPELLDGMVCSVAANEQFGTIQWEGGFLHVFQSDVISGGWLMADRQCKFIMTCNPKGQMKANQIMLGSLLDKRSGMYRVRNEQAHKTELAFKDNMKKQLPVMNVAIVKHASKWKHK